jgi:hypothetical protein
MLATEIPKDAFETAESDRESGRLLTAAVMSTGGAGALGPPGEAQTAGV